GPSSLACFTLITTVAPTSTNSRNSWARMLVSKCACANGIPKLRTDDYQPRVTPATGKSMFGGVGIYTHTKLRTFGQGTLSPHAARTDAKMSRHQYMGFQT